MYNILIPSAGGPAAICCIKSLRMSSNLYKLVGVDCNPLSAGFFLSDKGYQVPLAKNEKPLFKKLVEICKVEKIDIVMPTSGFDIPILANYRKTFEDMGIILPFSDISIVKRCQDKFSLYKSLKNKELMPFTSEKKGRIKLPYIIKPRIGKGPKRVFLCRNKIDTAYALSIIEDPIFQEPLPGKEYTVDVMSDLEGNPIIAVPRERIETKAGITWKGEIVIDKEIQRICLDIAKELKIKGPSCIQLKRDEKGKPKLIDLNPRMGGGTIIATLAGVNFPEILIKICYNETINIPKPRKITVTRYYEEIVVQDFNKRR